MVGLNGVWKGSEEIYCEEESSKSFKQCSTDDNCLRITGILQVGVRLGGAVPKRLSRSRKYDKQ